MSAIEINPITKPISIRVTGDRIVLPKAVRQKVDEHWQQLIKDNPRLRNGEVFTVLAVDENNKSIEIKLAETDYAHYLYSHQVGGLGEFTVRIIHSATLVITSDNKMLFGAMGEHTARPGVIQCCGGGIDHDDITPDGVVDIEHNTVKELGEELGLDPYDKSIVTEFTPAYLKTGGPTGKITLCYILRLTLKSSQLLQQYDEFTESLRHNGQEPEFGQLICIDADKRAVEAYIEKFEDRMNEFMPVLLRAAADVTRRWG